MDTAAGPGAPAEVTDSELAVKRGRLLAVMKAAGLEQLVLRRPANVAWYSGGGRTHILAAQDVGVAAVVVGPDRDRVFAPVNEAPRLQAEELGRLDAAWEVWPWDTDLAPRLPSGPGVGADGGLPAAVDVSAAVERARRSLLPVEVDRYRSVAADAAAAMTDACAALSPELTEYAAAGRLAAALAERALDPVVLLVAGATRVGRHRHPLPTTAPIGDLVMLVTCARRGGLFANLTRYVAFGRPDPGVRDAHARLLTVDVAYNAATRLGAAVATVFTAGAAAYGPAGFDPTEWRAHHQGGPTGYEPRDRLATAASTEVVEAAQAFAWNPSAAPGVKSEDTVLARTAGVEVLTADPRWPTQLVGGLRRPLIWER